VRTSDRLREAARWSVVWSNQLIFALILGLAAGPTDGVGNFTDRVVLEKSRSVDNLFVLRCSSALKVRVA